MNSAFKRMPRLVEFLGTLLLMLGLLAVFQYAVPQTARASSRTAPVSATIRSQAALKSARVLNAPQTSIQNQPCTSGRSTWVHVYTVSDGTFCLGFKGTYVFNYGNGRWVNKLTFGNNYGNIEYEIHGTGGSLVPVYENFDGGDPYANALDCTFVGGCFMLTLTIDGWH